MVIVYDESVEVLAHEVGHWLNLYHTTGKDDSGNTYPNWNSCHANASCTSQGDFICDTPPVDLSVSPANNCLSRNTCSLDSPDLDDDVDNLMSRESDCISTLTQGQVDRMEECLLNIRPNIWSNGNLISTGTVGFMQANPTYLSYLNQSH